MTPRFSRLAPLALLSAAVASIPVIFTLYSAATADWSLWKRLYETRLSELLPGTLRLVLSVSALTALIGVPCAWFITRFDFAGRRFFQWALVLPLAMPGYVLAYAYASLAAPGGLNLSWLYSFWGVSLALSLVNFPYVYLLSRAAFLSQNAALDDAARLLGASRWARLWTVHIRLAAPGIVAGVALAAMEVMADFGTVSMLRYPTFTEAVYRQMTARYDAAGAAALAVVFAVMTFLLMSFERAMRGKGRFEQSRSHRSYALKPASRALEIALLVSMSALILLAFVAPSALLVKWSVQSIADSGFDSRLPRFAFNSVFVSAAGATLAAVFALPVAYLHSRRPGALSRVAYMASTLGYSLPGPVIAVGLLIFAGLWFPWIYGSFALLLTAYFVRFVPVTLQAQDAALTSVSRSMEDAAQTLGAGGARRFGKILLPLMRPGLVTGWVLVFVDCMKELPATLMLRPLAFDTLAVRVWMEASESLWEMAALPALLIVCAGIAPAALIMSRMARGGAARA